MSFVAVNPSPPEFISADDEARVFAVLRRRIFWAHFRQALSQSRFRLSLVILLTSLLWSGMFSMFVEGFSSLQTTIQHPEMYARTVGAVFGAFFAALMMMLVFSSGIILYGSLYCSRECDYLLTTPARTQRIFIHKFHEAVLFSSWGFILLGSPMLLAYGTVERAPWYYYAMLAPYLVSFIYIPVAIGAIVCLLVVHRIPNGRLTVLLAGAFIMVCGAAYITWSLLNGPERDMLTQGWFMEILTRLQFSEQRLLPSWWLSSGLLSAAKYDGWAESLLFLALMMSNALFFRLLALWFAGRLYRSSYSSLYDRAIRKKRSKPARCDRVAYRALGMFSQPARLLIVNDLRLFRRDPSQWSQFLIFIGLLALYFFNVRHFTYNTNYIAWMNMVSFLNVAVVGLLLSTFTTRFIYPMISMEGRRFWILGLLPVRRETILWSKFLFAVGGSIVPCTLLVLLSDVMLSVSPLVIISHQLTCFVLCPGLAGIAVGLGAWLPNLREQSPSRIAAGFGGTLNLVVSTLYILAVVLLTALPIHFYLVARYADPTETTSRLQSWLFLWLGLGMFCSIILGTIATVVPLSIGLRAFRRMEF